MLTSKAVIAIIMLFLLSPVAKLIRRLIYALVEQMDRGNPADQAAAGVKSGAMATMGAIAGAGAAGIAGVKEMKSAFSKGGGSKPNVSEAMNKAAEETGSATGGYLVQTRGGSIDQDGSGLNRQGSPIHAQGRGNPGESKKQIVNHRGEPISSGQGAGGTGSSGSPSGSPDGSSDSTATPFGAPESSATMREGNLAGGDGNSPMPEGGPVPLNQPNERSFINGQNRADQQTYHKPDTIEKAGKWADVGRKTLAVAGGAVATAAGMTAGAIFGRQAGAAVARHGTKAFHHVGRAAGGAAGMIAHGTPRAVQHLRTGYTQARSQGHGRVKSMAHAVNHTGTRAKVAVSRHMGANAGRSTSMTYGGSSVQTSGGASTGNVTKSSEPLNNRTPAQSSSPSSSAVHFPSDGAFSEPKKNRMQDFERMSQKASVKQFYFDKDNDDSDD